MIKCAIIKNGVVVNLIDYSSVPTETPEGLEDGVYAISTEGQPISVGWTYNGSSFVNPNPVPEKTYSEKRAVEYPPYTDYLDGVVKGNQAQIDAYIAACQAVKTKYPKPE